MGGILTGILACVGMALAFFGIPDMKKSQILTGFLLLLIAIILQHSYFYY